MNFLKLLLNEYPIILRSCRTLSRNIRYALGADELADRVLQSTPASGHVTWRALLSLAGLSEPPSPDRSGIDRQEIPPRDRSQNSRSSELVPSAVESSRPGPKRDVEASDIDGGRSTDPRNSWRNGSDGSRGNNSLSPERERGEERQPDPVEVAIQMFKRIDRDGNGAVTHVELIKALRGDKKVAAVRNCLDVVLVITFLQLITATHIVAIYYGQALQLPSHIRQEDGSRDSYMACFNEIDTDGTGNISLDEFLQFIGRSREIHSNENSRGFRSGADNNGNNVNSNELNTPNRSGFESPAAPANRPMRLLDPEDRRAGVVRLVEKSDVFCCNDVLD